ncbi:ribosome silencing factor [Alkalicoccus chagannorensis]|uniref:ribosome silencing factor n=1 Tax=Alkalicoccus chagannorensis TaxID=427072 RepID=UPI0003F567CD|nr:ribosome silencing factor [Alkalicoccus chagannorensis]
MTNESERIVQTVLQAADEKSAQQIRTLNMEGISSIADYFVVCHGTSETQVEAIAREIKDQIEEAGLPVKRVEGMREARWILIDLADVVVHVFHKEDREYYQLEKMWGDAPVYELEDMLR